MALIKNNPKQTYSNVTPIYLLGLSPRKVLLFFLDCSFNVVMGGGGSLLDFP